VAAPHWRDVLLTVAPGVPSPARRPIVRAGLLRGWAEGLRTRVRAVTSPAGEPLAPAEVDWTGFPGGEPTRRPGRPETGRDAQTVIRSTLAQRHAWQDAAERDGLAIGEWIREALDAAARR